MRTGEAVPPDLGGEGAALHPFGIAVMVFYTKSQCGHEGSGLGSVFRCIRCPLDGWKCTVDHGWRRVLHSLWKSVLFVEAPSNSPAASANAAVGAVLIPSVPLAALHRRVYLSALKPVSSPAARRGRCDRVGGGALPTRARRGLRGERPWRRTGGATCGSTAPTS